MSHGTHGSGPWTCGAHFRGLATEKKGTAPVGVWAGIKARFSRKPDPYEEAERRALQEGL